MKQNYQLSNVKSKMVAFKWMMIIFIMAFFVQARAQITFTNVTSMPPNCASSMDGSIFIEAMGIGQLQYSIDNGTTYQSSNTFFGLAAGPYYLWINDANNVPTQYPSNPIIINGPLPIIINDITKTNPSAAGMNDGNININASGGTGSLQYSIDYGNYYYATNTFTNLMSGTYGIFVRDANNCVDFYPSNPVHLIAPIPQVNLMSPENLATVNLRTNLSWEYNISANQYHIQISDNSSFSNIVFQDSTLYSTNLTLSYDLLNQNTNYYWRVRGKNGTASGPFSIYREFTTVAGQIPASVNPEMPFNNDTIVEKNVNFYWQYSEFATKYILTLASDAGMSNVIDRDTVTNTNGYQFLNNNTTYFWNVKAINKYGESLVGITNKLTIDTAFIKHPITSNPSNNQTDVVIQPQLWWSYVNGASEYIVQVSTDTSVINIIWGDTTINTNTQVENGILNYNTSYFWRVRSKNSTRLSKFSPWSSFKTINNIPPISPTPSVPYNNAILNQTFVGLGWNYVPMANAYKVHISRNAVFGDTVVLDTTYNSYENYNLFHNQTFYWTVSALNAFGASTGNTVWSFTVDTNYLEAPTLISPYNKKTNEPLQPYFGWNQVNKANEYIIEVSTDSTFASSIWTDTINNTYAQVPFNLANNTSYFWRIKAKRNAYQSAYSEIYNFKTEAAIPPMAPTIDSPKGNIIINNTQTMLNWYGVNATEYYLQVATDSSFNNIYHNDTLTYNSFNITLNDFTQYFWRVKAKNNYGESAWSVSERFRINTSYIPGPKLNHPYNMSMNMPLSLQLEWQYMPNISKYFVEVSTDNTFATFIIKDSVTQNNYMIMPGKLMNNTNYFWRVRVRLFNNAMSDYSMINSFTTESNDPPSQPILYDPNPYSIVNERVVNFNWSMYPGMSKHYITIASDSIFTNIVKFDSVEYNQYSISLLQNNSYFWKIKIRNNYGMSPESEIAKFTIDTNYIFTPNLISPCDNCFDIPTNVNLEWTEQYESNMYFAEISDNNSFSNIIWEDSTTSTNIMVPEGKLTFYTTYYWRVKRRDYNMKMSGYSPWKKFTTENNTPPPVLSMFAPMNNDTVNKKEIFFEWQNFGNAQMYYYKIATDSLLSINLQQDSIETANYMKWLNNKTTYYWSVRARNKFGIGTWSPVQKFRIDTAFIPKPPVANLLHPSDSAMNTVTNLNFGWMQYPNIQYNILEISTDKNFTSFVRRDSNHYNNVYINPGILSYNTVYYWRVKMKSYEHTTTTYSKVYMFKTMNNTIPPTPTLASPLNNITLTIKNPVLSWNFSNNAMGYYVKVFSDAGLTQSVVFDSTQMLQHTVNLQNNKTYFWYIVAGNQFGKSANSEVRTFTIDTAYTVSPRPVANFIADKQIVQIGESIQFTDISTNSPNNWKWTFIGATPTTANISNPIVNYNAAGIYEVKLRVSNAGGADSIVKSAFITVNQPKPVASFIEDKTNIAVGESIQFSSTSTNNPTSLYWAFTGGTPAISNVSSPLITYNSPGTYNVKLIATNAAGADSIVKTALVTVMPAKPIADFASDKQVILIDESVQFTDESLNPVSIWKWEFAGGNPAISTVQNPNVVYNAPGVFDVKLIVSNVSGTDTIIKKAFVTVNKPAIIVDFTFTVNTDTVTFTNISQNAVNYFWSLGNGKISNELNPVHVYSNAGVYEVCLNVTNKLGDTKSICKSVSIGDYTVAINFEIPAINYGEAFAINNLSTGTAKNWMWEFGDGEISTERDPVHTYAKPGVFNICLTAKGLTGVISKACKQVFVGSGFISSNFIYSINELKNTVYVTDNSNGNVNKWYWSFGNGNFSSKKNDSIVFTPGIYNVCLSVIDTVTFQVSQSCKEIQIGSIENICNAQFDFIKLPENDSVFFFNTSVGNIQKYFWDFGNGFASTLKNPALPFKSGKYTIKLTISGADNCQNTAEKVVLIQTDSCDIRADFNHFVDNQTQQVKFMDASTGKNIEKFMWNFGNGYLSTSAEPFQFYKDAGIYKVQLTVSNQLNNCIRTTTKEVMVGKADCKAEFDVFSDSTTVSFKNNSLGMATKLNWMFGDGAISSVDNPVYKYSKPGYYTVGLQTYNVITGCIDFVQKNILVGELGNDCQASFDYFSDLTGDSSMIFINTSIGTNLNNYSWNFGDGTIALGEKITRKFQDSGYYNVCLTVTDVNDKCKNTACKAIKVGNTDKDCNAEFIYVIDTISRQVTFKDRSMGEPIQWAWSFGNTAGDTSQNQHPKFTYAANGYYMVKMQIVNAAGCRGTDIQLLNINAGNSIKGAFTIKDQDNINLGKIKEGPYSSSISNLEDSRLKTTSFGAAIAGNPSNFMWDFGDGNYDYSTLYPTHEYADFGSYNVCLTIYDVNTGAEDKTCETVVILDPSINLEEQNNNSFTFHVYPNPATSIITVEISTEIKERVNLELYNSLGSLVKSMQDVEIEPGTWKIALPLTNLAKGIYLLKAKTNAQIGINNVIIQ